ncbi:MAG: hypothetical protein A2046_07945 [Bacteroidetes bacterium GWA2_30_7]|nr:MAG: hypothetical protein A2046_07945 [Bacteroidetes bacterium GWA2_30_7]
MIIEKNIKNLIFDLGGILLNIDFQKSVDEFKKLGFSEFGNILNNYWLNDFFHDFEKGLILPKDFRAKIRKMSNINISDNEFDNAWNAMILDFPSNRIETLKSLSKTYSLFLLSNTNIIHYDIYNADFSKQFSTNGLEELFEKAYFSHQIKMRKPDLAIFKLVLDENNLIADETIFIDDNDENLNAAILLNISALKIVSNSDFSEVLKKYIKM